MRKQEIAGISKTGEEKFMKTYIQLLRVHHWVKNGLILLPLFFSGNFFRNNLLITAFLGTAAFCMLTSVVYIMNDLKDIEKDKAHSTKRNRPLASGAVSKKCAVMLAVVLFAFSFLLIGVATGWRLTWSPVIMLLYFAINIGYSLFGMKNIPILDVVILVSGFFLRVLFGAVLCRIVISNWLYLTVIAIAFYMGLGKRRNEILRESQGQSTRGVLQKYTSDFLDKNMYMCLSLAIVFYSLWTIDAVTVASYGTDKLSYTVPLIIVMCMKYSLTVEGSSDGDPVNVILGDKILMILGILYLFVIVGLRCI